MRKPSSIVDDRGVCYRLSPLAAALCWLALGCHEAKESGSASTQELTLQQHVARVRAGDLHRVHLRSQTITDVQLAHLSDLRGLRELELEQASVTSRGLSYLVGATDLEVVKIRGGTIDDDGLAHLCELPRLKRLNLPQTKITDSGCAQLRRLTQLQLLRLGSPRVTNEGIEKISQLENLRFLHLIGVPITDAALQSIQSMTTLESFYLDGAKVTDDGLWQLIESRPDLHIHTDQQHHDRDPRGAAHPH